jgi:hypothetical protein
VEAADSAADPHARARRLTRGASVAWDLGRFADAYGLLDAADRTLAGVPPCPESVAVEEARVRFDAADRTLAGVPPCPESVAVEEARVRFAARAGDLAGLEESIAWLEAMGSVVGSSRSRTVILFAHVGLAYQTGRYVDGLGIADELVTRARDVESPLVVEA